MDFSNEWFKGIIAEQLQHNAELEAEAITSYQEFLNQLENCECPEIVSTIKEIISDELNHAQKLMDLYIKITKIRPAED